MLRLAIAFSLLLVAYAGIAASRAASPAPPDARVRGQVLALQKAPGCGVILSGSPVVYRVISGSRDLVGKQITVLVACIEMPRMSGNVSHFNIGDVQDLVLTKRNVLKIELPSSITATSFYLQSASAVH